MENGCVFASVEKTCEAVTDHRAWEGAEICACKIQEIGFFQLVFSSVEVTSLENAVVSLLGTENDPDEKVELGFSSWETTQSVFGEVRLSVVWVETMEIADELAVGNPAHHAPAVDLHPSVHH